MDNTATAVVFEKPGVMALRSVAERAKAGDETLKTAPHYAPRRRLDETLAARKPKLAWGHLQQ